MSSAMESSTSTQQLRIGSESSFELEAGKHPFPTVAHEMDCDDSQALHG
jgi:hypothetical protein